MIQNGELPFTVLAELCASLEKTSGRIEKTRLLSAFLKLLQPDEIEPAVAMIKAERFQNQILECFRSVAESYGKRSFNRHGKLHWFNQLLL